MTDLETKLAEALREMIGDWTCHRDGSGPCCENSLESGQEVLAAYDAAKAAK